MALASSLERSWVGSQLKIESVSSFPENHGRHRIGRSLAPSGALVLDLARIQNCVSLTVCAFPLFT